MGGGGAIEDDEVAAVDGGGDGFPPGGCSIAAGSGEPGLVVGVQVTKHQGISVGGKQRGQGVL